MTNPAEPVADSRHLPSPTVAAFVCVLASAVTLSLLAAIEDRFPGDLGLIEQAQRLPDGLKTIADAVRFVTATEFVLAGGVVVCVVLWWRDQRSAALALALALVALPFIQGGLKDLVGRDRPDPSLVDIRGTMTSPSFPSGHVMSGTLLYGFLLYLVMRQPRWRGRVPLSLALAIVLLLNGAANIYLGVHWPSDVLGGYLWAGVLIVSAVVIDRELRKRVKNWQEAKESSRKSRPRGSANYGD